MQLQQLDNTHYNLVVGSILKGSAVLIQTYFSLL